MSEIAIRAEGLSKLYQLGRRERYYTLRDTIAQSFTALFRRFRNGRPPATDGSLLPTSSYPYSAIHNPDSIWALKDVSFEVKQGEVVGVIGRNGAGKSTLLKILSRITEPTEGYAQVNGRVGSLLEVGTGFHPELTGRENIYLNGAILGMKRGEIDRKFDEIVGFADVEKFLDTPVKHYSSGMYMRLAFSVAAHLEPEILLVDEVLAVGDAAFQKKCLGKMGEVAKEGRTVLFITHNMQAIKQLCTTAILLQSGRLVYYGLPPDAVGKYLHEGNGGTALSNLSQLMTSLPSDPVFKFENISITQDNIPVAIIDSGKPVDIAIQYQIFKRTTGIRIYYDLCDPDDTILFRSFYDDGTDNESAVELGRYISCTVIPENFLAPTNYALRIRGTIHNVRTFEPKEGICIRFSVERSGFTNKAYMAEPIRGRLAPSFTWTTARIDVDAKSPC